MVVPLGTGAESRTSSVTVVDFFDRVTSLIWGQSTRLPIGAKAKDLAGNPVGIAVGPKVRAFCPALELAVVTAFSAPLTAPSTEIAIGVTFFSPTELK